MSTLRPASEVLESVLDTWKQWYFGYCPASEIRQRDRKRERELAAMPYAEYLQTEEWQQIRKIKRMRAGYLCKACGNPGLLDIHHFTYERRGWEDADDLIVLCRGCHLYLHDIAEDNLEDVPPEWKFLVMRMQGEA